MSLEIVPVANPTADWASLTEELVATVSRVITKGPYILGPEVAAFEREMTERLGVVHSTGVGSGTDALILALVSIGVGPGDEVITVSHTAGPTVSAIHAVGAIPVLVDIERDTYCMDPKALASAVGPRTRAIISVHLYGHPADLDQIMEISRRHGIAVIEDCAQAQEATINGRSVGSLCDIGCFSFYPTKNLGAIGDGGLVSTRRAEIAKRLPQLRTYGWTRPQFAELPGGRCTRLDELQAAILRVKLPGLSSAIERRRDIAQTYHNAFKSLPIVIPIERIGYKHVYHLYVIRCQCRDELARHLEKVSVMTGVHYPFPVHMQPGLVRGTRIPRPLDVTETISREILTLPLYPSMSDSQQARVIDGVRTFFS
jgi:dTDP-4-amino-4,6-dideoxygalactose transaminase